MASTQSRECRKQALPGSMAPSTAQSREYRKATHPSNTPAFLANLGKATLRGIRRCPQCGIYNGTRGLSCKNKACGLVLRAGSQGVPRSSRRTTIEVVKVLMDGEDAAHSASGGVQVFSVVQSGGRGSSAPQMGFVELVPTDTAIATGDGATLLSRINLGRCFLPWCGQGQSPLLQDPPSSSSSSSQHRRGRGRRSIPSSSPSRGRAPSPDGVCAHIRRATECQSHATPLTVKSSVLDALQVSLQTRAELWRLATESPGPLVQRVNRDTLVVKCHADPEHPLGLLHVTTLGGATEPPREAPGGPEPLPHVQQAGFHCTCQQVNAKGVKAAPDGSDQAGSRRPAAGSNPTPAASAAEPCLHFYACVCAFASDDKLDFDCSGLINYNFNDVHQSSESRLLSAPEKIHHLPGRPDHLQQSSKRPCMDPSDPASAVLLPVGLGAEATSLPVGLGSEVTPPPGLRKAVQRKPPLHHHHHHHPFMMKSSGSSQAVEEHSVSMGFTQWLAGVTERINLTMHYQCDGKPEALVYHIPQEFFNALQHRLSLGSKKRRLPNTTTAFVRNDSLPLGSFSKYTWNITNLMQVKRIFDTPQMPLEVTQSFVKNMDGSFSPFHRPEHPDCPAETQHPERTTDLQCADRTTDPLLPDASRTDRPLAIRPMELRTFLKVGTFTEDQKEATPFVMEWIPDVLPRSRVGELRIRFQFGHQQSGGGGGGGPAEHGGGGTVASNPRRSGAQQSSSNKSPVVSIQPSHSQPVEVLQIVL